MAQELEGVIHDIEGHEGQWFAPVAHVPNKINPKLPLQAVLAMYEWLVVENVLHIEANGTSTVNRFGWPVRPEMRYVNTTHSTAGSDLKVVVCSS